uniref:Uncharacterized protein n=1 Tax=Rhodnius prolixus TaxID=13249 RepID=T1I992_RHOPR
MTEKKNELERRVAVLTQQRDNLSTALDEATDRIMLLERQMREQQLQMRVSNSELEELRSANSSLGDKIQGFSSSSTSGQRSLHSEMECDDEQLPEGDDLHQIIEQDRHLLRRKLATTQAECETRLVELQADIRELQRTLSDKENIMRQTEKEKNALIVELTEQNQRLTTQIKESSKTEEQLTVQLQGLREQANKRKSSLQDHQSSLDVLRDEEYHN